MAPSTLWSTIWARKLVIARWQIRRSRHLNWVGGWAPWQCFELPKSYFPGWLNGAAVRQGGVGDRAIVQQRNSAHVSATVGATVTATVGASVSQCSGAELAAGAGRSLSVLDSTCLHNRQGGTHVPTTKKKRQDGPSCPWQIGAGKKKGPAEKEQGAKERVLPNLLFRTRAKCRTRDAQTRCEAGNPKTTTSDLALPPHQSTDWPTH